MESIEMMKQLNLMCDNYRDEHECKGCPIDNLLNGARPVVCFSFIRNYPEKAEELVTRWTKENRPKRNLDELTQMIKRFCGDVISVEPIYLYPGISVTPSTKDADKFKDWLNEEYKENS